MTTDSSQPLPGAPRPEWTLPEITRIQIRRVPFQARKPRNFESALANVNEAVEFLVQTSGPIPIRALGPALFVGDVQVTESQQVGENEYRFLAYNIDQLKPGAPIRFGWINDPESERRETPYQYQEDRPAK